MWSFFTILFYSGLALFLGLGSAWQMVDQGSALTTGRLGPWSVWYSAGSPNADPYTKAHFARSGRLPITSTSALYYLARVDGEGDELTSECEYSVEGRPIDAAWWSIAAYETSGRLIPNKANRHAFSSRDVALRADGTFQIAVSRDARPGNWLPAGDSDQLQLVMRVYAPRTTESTVGGREVDKALPEIRRVACR